MVDTVLDERTVRVLVVTDYAEPSAQLLAAIRRRAAAGSVRFRVVVPNPARAELNLLHPDRHEKAHEAEEVLRAALPELESAASGTVIGSVSVLHDPMDAVEHTLLSEPIDEIMLAIAQHALARRIHQDLPHRLSHLGIPVTVIQDAPHSQ
jgi:hypothetical protein